MPVIKNRFFLFFQFASCFLFLVSCTSSAELPPERTLFVIRLDDQTLVNTQTQAALPLPSMPGCDLWSAYPAPRGAWLALEYDCPQGSVTSLLNAANGESLIPAEDTDSHFLGWEADGQALYLKVDVLGKPAVMYVTPNNLKSTSMPAETYHVSAANDGKRLYALTYGVGFGSELWLAGGGWRVSRRLIQEPGIISFATWSPDSQKIAYILMPDDMTPYPPGELWLADADGKNKRMLAPADAGHGYPPAWSPDNRFLAYIHRDSADDLGGLQSNIYLVDVTSSEVHPLTAYTGARVWGVAWSPDGALIAYNLIENDTITVQFQPLAGGAPLPLAVEGAVCCAAWLEVR